MDHFTTGNKIVDSIGTINFAGNIIPQQWYKTVLRNNGKPYLLAITILSDIVYWYRPTEVRDEASGRVIGWKKRFKEDLLQRSYDQFANLYGETKRSVTDAVICLEKLGVVNRVFRTIETFGGMKLSNVLFLELLPKGLYAITYAEADSSLLNRVGEYHDQKKINTCNDNTRVPSNDENPPTLFCDTGSRNNVEGVTNYQMDNTHNNATPTLLHSETNTKKRTQTINRDYYNHFIQSSDLEVEDGSKILQECTYLVKSNIEYELLMQSYHHEERKMIDDIVGLMIEVIAVKRETIRISGVEYPYALVKENFLKITSEHVKYVLQCLQNNSEDMRSAKPYLLTTLFNSVNTINCYYRAEVNHDNRVYATKSLGT